MVMGPLRVKDDLLLNNKQPRNLKCLITNKQKIISFAHKTRSQELGHATQRMGSLCSMMSEVSAGVILMFWSWTTWFPVAPCFSLCAQPFQRASLSILNTWQPRWCQTSYLAARVLGAPAGSCKVSDDPASEVPECRVCHIPLVK